MKKKLTKREKQIIKVQKSAKIERQQYSKYSQLKQWLTKKGVLQGATS